MTLTGPITDRTQLRNAVLPQPTPTQHTPTHTQHTPNTHPTHTQHTPNTHSEHTHTHTHTHTISIIDIELYSHHSEKGRGMELSELRFFGDQLLTFDDRSGMCFEITKDHKVCVCRLFLFFSRGWVTSTIFYMEKLLGVSRNRGENYLNFKKTSLENFVAWL